MRRARYFLLLFLLSVPSRLCLAASNAFVLSGTISASHNDSAQWETLDGVLQKGTPYTEAIMPTNGRGQTLYVQCATGISTGTQSFWIGVDGVTTAVTCFMSSGASTCSDLTHHVDYNAGQTLTFMAQGVSGATNPVCTASFVIAPNGGGTGHNKVMAWMFSYLTSCPGTTYTGIGSYVLSTDTSGSACQVTESHSIFVMPTAGTFIGMGINRVNNLSGGSTTYTLKNETASADTDLTITISSGSKKATSTTCTTNCTLD